MPPERELAAEIGVGRRALRRALEVLEDEGLIWRQQGKGTFGGSQQISSTLRVNNLAEFTNPIEVMEVRIEIEPVLARMAATKATPALIQQLEKLAAKAKEFDRHGFVGTVGRCVSSQDRRGCRATSCSSCSWA